MDALERGYPPPSSRPVVRQDGDVFFSAMPEKHRRTFERAGRSATSCWARSRFTRSTFVLLIMLVFRTIRGQGWLAPRSLSE
jgi:hypothetical protein